MDEGRGHSNRVISLTQAAHYDLAGIDNATAVTWGDAQADRYLAYLRETFSMLLDDPSLGSPIVGYPSCLVYTARYSRKRNSHGHRIFFRPTEGGIRIIRILHTAMNWPDHLSEVED